MSDKYNGWANYPTWRVMLEIFDGIEIETLTGDKKDIEPYDLSKLCEDYVSEVLTNSPGSTLALDYAFAFLADVDYREIAQAIIDKNVE